jgi:hypothetical protein
MANQATWLKETAQLGFNLSLGQEGSLLNNPPLNPPHAKTRQGTLLIFHSQLNEDEGSIPNIYSQETSVPGSPKMFSPSDDTPNLQHDTNPK